MNNLSDKQKSALSWMIDDALKELDQMREDLTQLTQEDPPSRFERMAYDVMDKIQGIIDKITGKSPMR